MDRTHVWWQMNLAVQQLLLTVIGFVISVLFAIEYATSPLIVVGVMIGSVLFGIMFASDWARIHQLKKSLSAAQGSVRAE